MRFLSAKLRSCCLPAALLPALLFPLVCGCGPAEEGADGGGEPTGVKIAAEPDYNLSIGPYMPPLPEGLELAPPAGWDFGRPPDENDLVMFYKADKYGLPRILVREEDSPLDKMQTVTRQNVEEFAGLIKAQLQKDGVKPIEQPRPMLLGGKEGLPVARYVRGAVFKGVAAERQFVVTLREGKLYTVELQVLAGQIENYRDAGYAAAAAIKFGEAPTPGKEESPEGEGQDVPAEGAGDNTSEE